MNPMQTIQQVRQWKENFQKQNPGANPQQIVQQLVQSGKVSQQQFEQARKLASMLGVNL